MPLNPPQADAKTWNPNWDPMWAVKKQRLDYTASFADPSFPLEQFRKLLTDESNLRKYLVRP